MMRILHISRMNFDSNKAHVYTMSKTCEAFAMQKGVEVTLLSSDNSLISDTAKQAFYLKHDIQTKFPIVSLSSTSNIFKKSRFRPFNWLETFFTNTSILWYVIKKRKNFDVLYYRDWSLILPILFVKYVLGKPIYIEIHAVLHANYKQKLNNFFCGISDGVIAISVGLADYYKKINPKTIVSFCAAAEPERFARITESKEQLREKFHLPQDKVILMYSGNLYKTGNNDSYGIEDIVMAMTKLTDEYLFIGVGKKGNETQEHEKLAKAHHVSQRVMFLPYVAKQTVYEYWKSSDILLLPAAGAQIGNSPTKMFEYLVSGKPIVSARTKAMEEVLVDGKNALLVTDYKNPSEWADAIQRVTNNSEARDSLVSGALEDSKLYTWDNRGKEITRFIQEGIH